MKKILFVVGALVCGWSVARAEVELKATNAYDFESITVTSTTAVGCTAAKLAPTNSGPVKKIFVTVETTDVRYRVDGSTPTQTTGHLFETTVSGLTISGEENIRHLSMVGVGASSTVQITYER